LNLRQVVYGEVREAPSAGLLLQVDPARVENRSSNGPAATMATAPRKVSGRPGKITSAAGRPNQSIFSDDELPENVAIGWPARIVNVPLS
jgi:hypothetical protein